MGHNLYFQNIKLKSREHAKAEMLIMKEIQNGILSLNGQIIKHRIVFPVKFGGKE